jgi:hypothetical protein
MPATQSRRVVLCASLVLFAAGIAYQSQSRVDPESLIALWLLDEGKGVIAEDASGNGNHGEFDGDPQWVDGKSGTALEFDGDDRVDCGDIDAIDGFTGLTAMAWCKWGGDADGLTAPARVVSKQDPTKGDVGPFSLGAGWAAHKMTLWIHHGNWAGAGHSSTSIDDGEWHHVAGTYDGAFLRVYVDGVEENSNEIGAVAGGETPEAVAIASDGSGREFWKGPIDEVALFNVGLGPDEILDVMTRGLAQVIASVSRAGKLAAAWGDLKTR